MEDENTLLRDPGKQSEALFPWEWKWWTTCMRRSLGSEAELPWFENQTRFTIKGIKARNIWNFRKYRVYSQGHKVPTGYSIMLRMDVAEYGYWIWSYMCPKYHLGPPPLLKIILISLLMIQRWLTWQLPVPAPASRALSLTVKCLAAAPSPATAFSDITQTKTQTYDNKYILQQSCSSCHN